VGPRPDPGRGPGRPSPTGLEHGGRVPDPQPGPRAHEYLMKCALRWSMGCYCTRWSARPRRGRARRGPHAGLRGGAHLLPPSRVLLAALVAPMRRRASRAVLHALVRRTTVAPTSSSAATTRRGQLLRHLEAQG
jgi:hypothetical protein